jgi:hypothetical protein
LTRDGEIRKRGVKIQSLADHLSVAGREGENELSHFSFHEATSETAMTTRPMSTPGRRSSVSLRKRNVRHDREVQAQIIWGANLIPSGAACAA